MPPDEPTRLRGGARRDRDTNGAADGGWSVALQELRGQALAQRARRRLASMSAGTVPLPVKAMYATGPSVPPRPGSGSMPSAAAQA
jgi:hypothetical protein